jgi:glucuronoarabinoxylan endo-1,4-beta-xylanase
LAPSPWGGSAHRARLAANEPSPYPREKNEMKRTSKLGLAVGLVALATACSNEVPDNPQGSGGTTVGSGGTAVGGNLATGGSGVLTGGQPSSGGQSSTGGRATGGTSTGGTATGGQATGGTSTGGTATGGQATGGTSTGGTASGGRLTGGTSSGGTATGGKASGGTSTGGTGAVTGCGAGTSTSSDVVVNLSGTQQKISGFGASTAWGSTMSSGDADLLWSTTSGAGLSLHRIRIDTTGTGTSETNIAKLAVARGATVWATPWTPPAADKDNNNTVMGHLSNGQDFANKLATFVSNMKNQGVPIYAVSAQNEPDANVTYESCVYTGDTIAAFVAQYMGPALANSGVKLMAPETQNWCGFQTFWPLIKANTAAMSYLSIIATHEYGCSVKAYADIAQAGKEFWETEIYDQGSSTADPGMGSALRVVKLIHDALTIANMNAWHYWWVYPSTADNGALWDKGTNAPSKRLWIMGNYSRFARPGYQRVSTSGSVPSGVLLTAYKSPTDGTVVVVAANNNTNATNLSVFISGAAPCSMTPWVTSSSDSLASKSAVSVSGSRFTFSLGAQSVTTFVGKP